MITDAAKNVASLAGEVTELPLGKPSFRPADRYKAKDFDVKNFRPIKTTAFKNKIAFLDGGNLPLIKAPSFSVHFARVYHNCFNGAERVNLGLPQKIEFFIVVSGFGGDDVKYKTSLIPLDENNRKYLPDEKDLIFDSYDSTMTTGGQQIEISRIGEVARSFAEWKMAAFVNRELKTRGSPEVNLCAGSLKSEPCVGDLFVRDGTLHAPYTNESKYADEAYKEAEKNGVLFCGVSKTSQLYTTTGLPLVVAIGRLARQNHIKAPGYYTNIVEITDPAHRADLSFARFHARAENTFRVEILKCQEAHRDKIMSALAESSKDLSFPGYPYGLIDADKNARVSYDELNALRTLLFSEISKTRRFNGFKDFLAGGEAHDWLNKIV